MRIPIVCSANALSPGNAGKWIERLTHRNSEVTRRRLQRSFLFISNGLGDQTNSGGNYNFRSFRSISWEKVVVTIEQCPPVGVVSVSHSLPAIGI